MRHCKTMEGLFIQVEKLYATRGPFVWQLVEYLIESNVVHLSTRWAASLDVAKREVGKKSLLHGGSLNGLALVIT